MSNQTLNVSGACGGGSSVKIYETPEFHYPWRGGYVMHGFYCVGPASPDDHRIEIVELFLAGLNIRVRADAVRAELKALQEANKKADKANFAVEQQPARHQAFTDLQAAVLRCAAPAITFSHIGALVGEAFDAGVQQGEALMQERFRALLGL